MSEPVIFRDLPATFPEKDKYQKPSIISSIVFHGLLILIVIVIPLLMPQTISQRELLVRLVAPLGPPPPPPPPPAAPVVAPEMPKPVQPPVRPVTPDVLVAPTVIPRDVARVVDEPIAIPVGVIGGVPGGVPGGVIGGVLNSMLTPTPAPPPPPPPAFVPPPPPPPPPKAAVPAEPVRVGGLVREPRPLKVVPPVYPQLALKARIAGTVILEATVTVDGTVDQIRVVSGHPLLVEAAIDCVKQWKYEPTLLNGVPVPVILTAVVHFQRATQT